MSSGTGATYWGNSNRYTTSATYQTAPLDTSQYPAGKYRLLARVCQETGTGYIKDSQNNTAIAITRTTPHILVVGDLDLPVADTAPGTAANLTISVKSDGTNDCLVNALILLPLNYGYFSWHHDTPTSEIDQLDVGPSGIFMDGVTDMTYFAGGILVPRVLAAHTGTLVSPASPAASWPSAWGRTSGDRTNYCTAPSFELGAENAIATGWTAVAITGSPTYSRVAGRVSGLAQRIQYTAVAGDSTNRYQADASAVGSFAAGDNLICSVYVKGSLTGCTLDLRCDARDAAGTSLHTHYANPAVGADWSRVSVSMDALPANTSRVSFWITVGSLAAGDSYDLTIDDVLIEKSPVLLPYFDGSTPSAAWTGTANASTSTKGEVSADATGLLFEIATTTGSKYAWYAATNQSTPIVLPGAWYEVDLTRYVTSRTAGTATVDLIWQDVDGNTVRTDTLSTTATTDAAPVALELYAKAPYHATRAQVRVGAGTGASLAVYFSAVVFRRCPLRLIVAAEDAAGALTTYVHPVHVSVKYTPRYEVSRSTAP